MLLAEHYITLLLDLPDPKAGETLSIGVAEVAEKFRCTPRNANLLLKRLTRQGLVAWQPGVGRGNRSKLTIQADLGQVLPQHFDSLLRRGDLDRAAALLRDDRVPAPVRERLHEALQHQFGLQAEAGAGRPRDVLKMPLPYTVGSLDPARLLWVTESWVSQQVFDAPLRFDSEAQAVLPHVAHTWDASADFTEWTLYLRKGVRFHHGKSMVAGDVVHSLERLANSPAGWLLHGVLSVDTLGDYGVRLKLHSPNLLVPHLLAHASAAILPIDLAWDDGKVVGTGPFRVSERSDAVFVLEAWGAHFQGRPLLDRVELWTMPPDAMPLGAAPPGAQRMNATPPDVMPRRYEVGDAGGLAPQATGREYDVLEQGCQFLAFDYRRPGPQHDPAFRRALRLALDRMAWVRDLGGERIAPAAGFSPYRSAAASWSGAAIAAARAWLDRSAYQGERFHLYYKPTPETSRDAEWVVRRCGAVGVRIALHPHPHGRADGMAAAPGAASAPALVAGPAPGLYLNTETFGADQATSYVQMLAQERSAVRQSLATHWAGELDRFRDRLYAAAGQAERDLVAAAFEQWLAEDCKLLCNYHVRKRVGAPTALHGFQTGDFGLPDLRRLWIRP
ncbi:MAG: ABC transporter substrate-binding protein [Symbiobacteriia bacterium]